MNGELKIVVRRILQTIMNLVEHFKRAFSSGGGQILQTMMCVFMGVHGYLMRIMFVTFNLGTLLWYPAVFITDLVPQKLASKKCPIYQEML